MSKKLPKENLKKVSGAKGAVTGSKNVLTGDALQGKKIAGGRNLVPGQVTEGKIAGSKGITAREGFDE